MNTLLLSFLIWFYVCGAIMAGYAITDILPKIANNQKYIGMATWPLMVSCLLVNFVYREWKRKRTNNKRPGRSTSVDEW
jgi:membrane protein DedA with SNARE-associated domain